MSAEPDEPQKKGRGNAILTYETVSEIKEGLIKLVTEFEALKDKLQVHSGGHQDHEVRLRVLEAGHAASSASQRSTSEYKTWIIATAIAVGQLAIAVATYVK